MFKFAKIFHENVIFIMSFFFSNEVTLSLEKKKKKKVDEGRCLERARLPMEG